jgi:hypothetical protein
MAELNYMKDFDCIVSFYITSYLQTLQNNSTCDEEFFIQLNLEYAFKSLDLFKYAIFWEIEKAFELWDDAPAHEIEEEDIMQIVREYPSKLTDRYDYLGKNWYDIAKIVMSTDTKNIVKNIDILVDMEHNNGNVLNRVVRNYHKYMEFLTTKAHAHDIREMLPYSDDDFLKKTAIRTVNVNGTLDQGFSDGYTDFLVELEITMTEYDDAKLQDIENIKRKIKSCRFYGVDETLAMISENSYAFGGEITSCNAKMDNFTNSIINSGKFENCYIKDSKIDNGYFKNCVLENCRLTGSPTLVSTLMIDGEITYGSGTTLDNCMIKDVEVYSDIITIVNSSEIDVNLLA